MRPFSQISICRALCNSENVLLFVTIGDAAFKLKYGTDEIEEFFSRGRLGFLHSINDVLKIQFLPGHFVVRHKKFHPN